MANYDVIGSIAIMKFDKESFLFRKKKSSKRKTKFVKDEKLKQAKQLLKRKNIKTVLEKTDRVKGRLRTIKTKFLAGEKTKEAVHKENDCRFRLNVETCYFSPRLSEERKDVAGKIKKKDKVLVMFSGVGPYSIIIAKKARQVTSIELSRACYKYAKDNVKLNRLNNVEVIQGDVKKVIRKGGLIVKGNLVPLQFDKIVMPRPNLRESFLKQAFSVSKKDTVIYYYCFGRMDKLNKLVEEVYRESKKARKRIKVLKIKKAGDIAPYKFRYRIDIKLIN